MKTLLKILGIIAGMAVIGVALTYGILYYLNNSKPTAKKTPIAAPAVEVLADSKVKTENAKILENGIIHCRIVILIKTLSGLMKKYRLHYMKWHIKK